MKLYQEGPKLFFKYQTINKYSLQNLAKNELWISSISAFNDPFEFKYELLNPNFLSNDKYKKFLKEINSWGVLCLSTHKKLVLNHDLEDSNIHPDNMLMWSHYSDSHYGFCLGLRKRNLIYPVNYSKTFPKIDLSVTEKQIQFEIMKIIHTKQLCWSHENEYRVVNIMKKNVGIQCKNFFEIERIYFGLRTPRGEIELIKSISKNQNFKYYQAKLAQNKFELEFHEV